MGLQVQHCLGLDHIPRGPAFAVLARVLMSTVYGSYSALSSLYSEFRLGGVFSEDQTVSLGDSCASVGLPVGRRNKASHRTSVSSPLASTALGEGVLAVVAVSIEVLGSESGLEFGFTAGWNASGCVKGNSGLATKERLEPKPVRWRDVSGRHNRMGRVQRS